MSNLSIIPVRVLYDTRIQADDITLLNVLCVHTDENGWCFPSLERIAKIYSPLTGRTKIYDESSISRKLRRLEKLGYLFTPKQLHKDGGGWRSNRYKVLYDATLPLEFDRREIQASLEKSSVENQASLENPQGESQTNAPGLTTQINAPDSGGAKPAPPPESASAEQKSISLDKESSLDRKGDLSAKLPDAQCVVQRKLEIMKAVEASGAGAFRPEVADPRKARKAFVREYEGRFAAIVRHAMPTTTDRAATGKAFDLRFDRAWLDERLSAYANGEGAEFRKPGANGYWIVNKLEEDRARGTLKKQGLFDDEYRKYVHGTPEHEKYREVCPCDLCDRADAADELGRGAGDAEVAG